MYPCPWLLASSPRYLYSQFARALTFADGIPSGTALCSVVSARGFSQTANMPNIDIACISLHVCACLRRTQKIVPRQKIYLDYIYIYTAVIYVVYYSVNIYIYYILRNLQNLKLKTLHKLWNPKEPPPINPTHKIPCNSPEYILKQP